MKQLREISPVYLWGLALALGLGIYLLYPAALPLLLFGGMLLMHLGGHGGHGHEAREHDPQAHQPRDTGAKPAHTAYRAGFNDPRRADRAADEAETKPHRGCH